MVCSVVVGAGSGGCVAASRLSEDPECDVTLLEAGPPMAVGVGRRAVDDPDALRALREQGRTYPDLAATRCGGGVALPYAAGRGVGGTSAVNAMLAMRGDSAQYTSWGWTDAEAMWRRVAIPAEQSADDEIGVVDRALLAADERARRVPLTRRDGRRVTSADAYLAPAADRTNLAVRADTSVDRVLLDGRRVEGVLLEDGTTVSADRVVLAAGALHTPALLLRSEVDAPGLGDGLQDHPSVAIALELRAGPAARDGFLASTVLELDDLQILPLNHTDDGVHAGLAVALMRPIGRAGRVRLDPADPGGEPLVDLDLFADPRDLGRLRSGVRLLLDLLGRPPFRELVAEAYIDDIGTGIDTLVDDASIDRWIRSAPGMYRHATSTCAIGTVLDQRGAVRGFEGLYVCDASALPGVPSANPHLPITMMAERLAAQWSAT
ncbi:MAG: GMC family oxidoreductase [Acidimicrobiia bacterium]|nr:GMC family oxidoreductase [Acidimicrobiia bacterium]